MSYANKSPRLEGILVASIPSSVFLCILCAFMSSYSRLCVYDAERNRCRRNDNLTRASTHSLHAAQLILEPG